MGLKVGRGIEDNGWLIYDGSFLHALLRDIPSDLPTYTNGEKKKMFHGLPSLFPK